MYVRSFPQVGHAVKEAPLPRACGKAVLKIGETATPARTSGYLFPNAGGGRPMRVAIFHDYFGAIGGGERVVLTLARAFDATGYTTDIHRQSGDRLGFAHARLPALGGPRPPAP